MGTTYNYINPLAFRAVSRQGIGHILSQAANEIKP